MLPLPPLQTVVRKGEPGLERWIKEGDEQGDKQGDKQGDMGMDEGFQEGDKPGGDQWFEKGFDESLFLMLSSPFSHFSPFLLIRHSEADGATESVAVQRRVPHPRIFRTTSPPRGGSAARGRPAAPGSATSGALLPPSTGPYARGPVLFQ